MIMKNENIFKACAITLVGGVQLTPCVLLASDELSGCALGFIYTASLWYFWSSTRIGRRFSRAFYLSALRLEKFVYGKNVEC